MNTLQVVTQMEAAGAQGIALSLAEGLAGLGHTSDVLFLYTKRPVFKDPALVRSLLPHPPRHPGHYARILWRLFLDLARKRPDAVITHTHYANVLVQPLAWLAGVRVRVAVQHSPVDTYPLLARLCDPLWGLTGIYRAIVGVSLVVERSVSQHSTRYRQKFRVIPNGIRPPPRDLLAATIPVPSGGPVLISVGRLSPEKNPAFLLDVMRHLSECSLVLVGEGELRNALEGQVLQSRLAERVLLAGELEHARVHAYLAAARVFVCASLYEGLPLAVLEAMAVGLPVVATDIAPVRDVLTLNDGALAGILVKPGNTILFAQAVQRLLADPALWQRISCNALRRARDFDVQTMVLGYHRLLEALAAKRSCGRPREPERCVRLPPEPGRTWK